MAATTDKRTKHSTEWQFSLQQHAQLVAKTSFIASHGEQQCVADDETAIDPDVDTTNSDCEDNLMILKSGLPGLKRRFLDRLAEIFAREKQASFVAATAMDEYEDKFVIYVVRNESFTDEDDEFSRHLRLCLEACSTNGSFTFTRFMSLLMHIQHLRLQVIGLSFGINCFDSIGNDRPLTSRPYAITSIERREWPVSI